MVFKFEDFMRPFFRVWFRASIQCLSQKLFFGVAMSSANYPLKSRFSKNKLVRQPPKNILNRLISRGFSSSLPGWGLSTNVLSQTTCIRFTRRFLFFWCFLCLDLGQELSIFHLILQSFGLCTQKLMHRLHRMRLSIQRDLIALACCWWFQAT